jgi:hypothetical protein
MEKNMNRIYMLTLFCFVYFSTSVAQEIAKIDNDSVNNNSVYIGFTKASSEQERLSLLNSAPGTVMEILDLMEYPIYRVELDEPATKTVIDNLQEQFKDETAVLFVTNKRNLDEKQFGSFGVKRQGDMSISKNKATLDKSASLEYRQIILNHMPGLNVCVEKYYPGKGRHKVQALYEINIDNRGAVQDVRLLKSNIKYPQLRNCLKKKIAGWRDFPRRRNDEDLTLKFKFNY